MAAPATMSGVGVIAGSEDLVDIFNLGPAPIVPHSQAQTLPSAIPGASLASGRNLGREGNQDGSSDDGIAQLRAAPVTKGAGATDAVGGWEGYGNEEPEKEEQQFVHRQSMYVRIVDEMLDTVLEGRPQRTADSFGGEATDGKMQSGLGIVGGVPRQDWKGERYLFTEHEIAVLEMFRNLEYSAKYLLTRLLLRSETRVLSLPALQARYSSELGAENIPRLMDILGQPIPEEIISLPHPNISNTQAEPTVPKQNEVAPISVAETINLEIAQSPFVEENRWQQLLADATGATDQEGQPGPGPSTAKHRSERSLKQSTDDQSTNRSRPRRQVNSKSSSASPSDENRTISFPTTSSALTKAGIPLPKGKRSSVPAPTDVIVIEDSSDEDESTQPGPTRATLRPEDMRIDMSEDEEKMDPDLARVLRQSAWEAYVAGLRPRIESPEKLTSPRGSKLERSAEDRSGKNAASPPDDLVVHQFDLRGKGKQVVTVGQERSFYHAGPRESKVMAFTRTAKDMSVEELIWGLAMTDLVAIAKELKCWKSKDSKPEVIEALLSSANKQTRLPFVASLTSQRRANTEPQPHKLTSQADLLFRLKRSISAAVRQPSHQPARSLLHTKILERYGQRALQVTSTFRDLIGRVNLVYYRSSITPASGKVKSLMLPEILKSSSKRAYPEVTTLRSIIWPDRRSLMEYERALELEAIVDEALGEQNHSTGTWIGPTGYGFGTRIGRLEGAKRVRKVWEAIYPKWKAEVTAAKLAPAGPYGARGHILERFHLGHILTRLVSKGTTALGVLHEYDLECQILRELLEQRIWRRGKRGAWYERLALVKMTHYQGDPNKKREAVEVCLDALEDPDTHLIYRPRLSRRLRRLEKQLQLPPDECHICEAALSVTPDRTIEAERVYKPSAPRPGSRPAKQENDDEDDDREKGDPTAPIMVAKTRWQGRMEAVSVEQRVIEWWEDRGFDGYHSESSILTTLFGLLFWPVLFADLPGVFETPYQLAPLDLGDDSFYQSRKQQIEERLARMANTKQCLEMLREVDDRERPRGTLAIGVRWEFPKHHLEQIVECMGGKSLAVLCRMFCEEYGHRASGVPDLIVWNYDTREMRMVEVKSPNDRLSETQKVWISVLCSAGIPVEVCHVVDSREKAKGEFVKRNSSPARGAKSAKVTIKGDRDSPPIGFTDPDDDCSPNLDVKVKPKDEEDNKPKSLLKRSLGQSTGSHCSKATKDAAVRGRKRNAANPNKYQRIQARAEMERYRDQVRDELMDLGDAKTDDENTDEED